MKVVITSSGNSADAKIDSHFGRCSYYVFYDTLSQSIEFLPNPHKEIAEGAGEAALELIVSRGVVKIITGELGIKIMPLIDRLKIQVIILRDKKKSLQEIIHMLKNG